MDLTANIQVTLRTASHRGAKREFPGSALESAPEGAVGNRGAPESAPEGAVGNRGALESAPEGALRVNPVQEVHSKKAILRQKRPRKQDVPNPNFCSASSVGTPRKKDNTTNCQKVVIRVSQKSEHIRNEGR